MKKLKRNYHYRVVLPEVRTLIVKGGDLTFEEARDQIVAHLEAMESIVEANDQANEHSVLTWESHRDQHSEGVTITLWRGEYENGELGRKSFKIRYILMPTVEPDSTWMVDRVTYGRFLISAGCELISKGHRTLESAKAAAEADALIRIEQAKRAEH